MRSPAASYRAAFLCAALALAGCGDGGEPLPPPEPPALGVERVFPALVFSQPVAMLQAPGDTTRWFVVEQAGRVRVFANSPQAGAFTTFADITDRVTAGGEMGLLGMAFHPQFPTDPRVFLSYTNDSAPDGRVSRISEFTLGAGGGLDTSTEQILLTISQPETNHNGGHVAFDRDGFLHIGIGDGGGGNDQHGATGNGQLMTTLLGKMLRIDVSVPGTYAVPGDNPFAGAPRCNLNGTGGQACPEIYAAGFRNPWRWSFDRAGGTLWVGDVGQGQREEIDRVANGGNYGWRCFEGTLATGLACGPALNLLPPIAEYGRGVGASVTGGFVYRGTAIAGLFGRYVFGDFVSGRLMHIASGAQPTVTLAAAFETGLNIASFGEDAAGELYAVHYGGELYRIVPR
jgi:glucose/arabinose dehydrogenase